jgi:hypothetical protein
MSSEAVGVGGKLGFGMMVRVAVIFMGGDQPLSTVRSKKQIGGEGLKRPSRRCLGIIITVGVSRALDFEDYYEVPTRSIPRC